MTLKAVKPGSVGDRAEENLVFIRQAMERSATFTSIPGAGVVAMGVVALVASVAGAQQPEKVYRIAFVHPNAAVAGMTEVNQYFKVLFSELRRPRARCGC